MREALKHVAEAAFVSLGAARAARALVRGRILILAYHNIVPHGERLAGERSLHLRQKAFGAQLDLIALTHDVVPLADALQPDSIRAIRPRAVVTWDDAYAGAVTAGVEEVARRGMPATIFVAPGFVGGRAYWWDDLADVSQGRLGEARRAVFLRELAGRDEAIRRTTAAPEGPSLPANARGASESELLAAARHPGITFGAHSWDHPSLTRLGNDDLTAELCRPLEWLRQRFASTLPVLAYPYGLWNPAVAVAVAQAGYQAALRIDGGWLPKRPSNPFTLPRLSVPAGLSPDGFALRLSGLLCR